MVDKLADFYEDEVESSVKSLTSLIEPFMIVFVAICWRYIYPPIVAAMQERQKKISDGLEAAKKADDSLEEAKLAYEKELDQAKSEAAAILDKANARASQIVNDATSN